MKASIYPQWWREHFLAVEMALAVVLGSGFEYWLRWRGGTVFVSQILNGGRAGVYGALASIFESLLGFVIASISIVIGFATSEKLAVLRRSKHYADLWRVFTSATKVLGITTLLALAGLVFDKDAHPIGVLLSLCITGVLLSIFRVARCIWVSENLIGVLLTNHSGTDSSLPLHLPTL
jgi:hypothetical protein